MHSYQVEEKVRRIVKKVLNSIIDPELKTLVEEKTFLTGGCFKSIYHGEKVNDYDFYFIDRESAIKFEELLKKRLEITSTPFTNQDELKLKGYNWLDKTSKSQFAITFMLEDDIKIQFITRYVGSPEEVTRNFDFKHTHNYYILKNQTFSIDYKELNDKELIFNEKASHPINALKRLGKFLTQGWTITDTELIKIAESINKLDLDTYSNWKEQTLAMYDDRIASNIIIFNNNVANEKTKEVMIKWVD